MRTLHTPSKLPQRHWRQDVVPGGSPGALESISWEGSLRNSSQRYDSHRLSRVKLASSEEQRGASHLLSEHVTQKGVPRLARSHARATREELWASSRDILHDEKSMCPARLQLETWALGDTRALQSNALANLVSLLAKEHT